MRGNFRWREFVFASIRGVKRTTGTRLLAAIMAGTLALAQAAPPRLEKHGNGRQLVVDGRPFLILGGELGNSSASSAAYMQPHWPRLRAMHLNTVLAPVYWELVEPRQGSFDWTSLGITANTNPVA